MAITGYIKDWRIAIVIVIVILLAMADVVHGLNFGVEFAGGTEIPITLAHAVNPLQMSTITGILDLRISKFGLNEITVQPVGNSGIYVTVPTTTGSEINNTIAIIKQQGVFQGVVDGREALNGSGIVGGLNNIGTTVTPAGRNVTWTVDFVVTQQAQNRFSRVVFGQANKPIYMFLDRPTQAVVLFNSSLLTGVGSEQQLQIAQMEQAVQLGTNSIPIEFLNSNSSNWQTIYGFLAANKQKYNTIILQRGSPSYIISNITSLNYSLMYENLANMTPQFVQTNNLTSPFILNAWPAVGLLSAPTLSPGLTNGQLTTDTQYEINGVVQANTTLLAAENTATNKSNQIATILSGGALPVQVIVGQPIVTQPTLGKHFEVISAVALLLAILAVGITIVIRYKKLFLITPIILTTLAELFIIGSIMGLVATIDLSAIAGMIAVVGTGVDAQIIITDEVLEGHKETTLKTRISHAFYIIIRNAGLLSLAMLPLFFSALTTEIWFAGATIIGALLGAALTRPAYGAILSKHYGTGE